MTLCQRLTDRFEPIVRDTLEALAAVDEKIFYDINFGPTLFCNDDGETATERPGVTVIWMVTQGPDNVDAGQMLLRLTLPFDEHDLQAGICEGWESLQFQRQAASMLDLDQQLDAIAEGDQ